MATHLYAWYALVAITSAHIHTHWQRHRHKHNTISSLQLAVAVYLSSHHSQLTKAALCNYQKKRNSFCVEASQREEKEFAFIWGIISDSICISTTFQYNFSLHVSIGLVSLVLSCSARYYCCCYNSLYLYAPLVISMASIDCSCTRFKQWLKNIPIIIIKVKERERKRPSDRKGRESHTHVQIVEKENYHNRIDFRSFAFFSLFFCHFIDWICMLFSGLGFSLWSSFTKKYIEGKKEEKKLSNNDEKFFHSLCPPYVTLRVNRKREKKRDTILCVRWMLNIYIFGYDIKGGQNTFRDVLWATVVSDL